MTSAPANLDPNSGKFGAALDLLGRANPEFAAEIRQAHSDGTYGFIAILSSGGQLGWHSRSGGGTIALLLNGRNEFQVCGTLAHEWEHARRRGGAEGNPPTTSGEENDPCGHMAAVCRKVETLEDLADSYCLDEEDSPVPCSAYESAKKKCSDQYAKCEDSGGNPSCSCGYEICDCTP